MALMYGNGGASSRRRRDSRGRYMEGDYGSRNEYEVPYGNNYGGQMRQMGFGATDEYGINDNDIRRRNTGRERGSFSEQGEHERYPTGASMHYGKQGGMQMPRQGGMQMYGMTPPLTREMAEEWVESMEGESERGETWTMEEIEELAKKHGYPQKEKKLVELYAVMNMLASDYYKVAEKFSVLEDEFFLCMAKAFIEDKDAVPDKVAAYYEYIVKKD